MKKCISILLAALLLLSCAACTSGGTAAAPTAAETAAPTAAETTAPTAAETTAPATAAPTTETTASVKEEAPQETLVKDDLPVRVTSKDGLVTLELPTQRWAELHSDAHTILFSDGDCAISIDLYQKNTTPPTVPLSDETHKLIFTSSLSVADYLLFITGFAHDETDFSPIATAIGTIRIDKNKIPAAVVPQAAPNYTIQTCNNDAWVIATSLNVRSDSSVGATAIAALPKGTKVTVVGEVLEDGRYIGWSKIRMSNGTLGFVASQFLSGSQPVSGPEQTGKTMKLWNYNGISFILFNYTDGSWKTDDGITYWYSDNGCWVNSAGKALYEYDPSYVPPQPAAPSKTGNSMQLWTSTGSSFIVYEYTDCNWREHDSGNTYWPSGFSTWSCSNGSTYYDYDPNYVDTLPDLTGPSDAWKTDFEASLYSQHHMIACWYSYLGDGYYEVYCQDPDNPNLNGTVIVDSYTGSWEWA